MRLASQALAFTSKYRVDETGIKPAVACPCPYIDALISKAFPNALLGTQGKVRRAVGRRCQVED